jgi:hypothetical protein
LAFEIETCENENPKSITIQYRNEKENPNVCHQSKFCVHSENRVENKKILEIKSFLATHGHNR